MSMGQVGSNNAHVPLCNQQKLNLGGQIGPKKEYSLAAQCGPDQPAEAIFPAASADEITG
jgi:hypothetical protein